MSYRVHITAKNWTQAYIDLKKRMDNESTARRQWGEVPTLRKNQREAGVGREGGSSRPVSIH